MQDPLHIISWTDEAGGWDLQVERKVLLGTPEWEPGQGEPPVTITRAVQLLVEPLSAQRSRFDRCVPIEVRLERLSYTGAPARWFYILTFAPAMEGRVYFEDRLLGVVLLDETVLLPQRNPR